MANKNFIIEWQGIAHGTSIVNASDPLDALRKAENNQDEEFEMDSFPENWKPVRVMDNGLSNSKPLIENKEMVLIEVIDGVANVIDKPEGVRVVIVDWDVARDGGFDVPEIARMFEHQDMLPDKALHYAQQIYNEELDFENEYEQVMEEFLSGTFDQPFDSNPMKKEV